MTVQWGILSTARINGKLLAGAAQSQTAAVTAVASRDVIRAREYAEEHGIERAYGSYEELLADPQLDAVYISLPNSMHLEWTQRALCAGKHVLCEKPLGRRTADVQAAFALAEREGRLLMEAFMYRHNPQTLRMTELVRDGAIGRLRLVRGAFSFALGDEANVRLDPGLDGGALMDVGCYCVSAARLLAGEPERVTGEQVLGGGGVDVAFTGTMRFADQVLGHFDAGIVLAGRDELEVVGENGSLYLDDPWHCLEPVIEVRRDEGVERIELERVNSYMLELDNLSAAIRGEAEPLLGRDDALGQARAIEALYESAAGGQAVVPGGG
jgi:D-xylose 1-dehydrogenase (NADP+, D-xylono-1,5-lactone-forming)